MTKKQIEKAKAKLAKQEKKEMFKRARAYVVATGILPAIIDDLEDLENDIFPKEINDQLKKTIEMLMAFDDLFLTGTELSVRNHQDFLKREFRQWINEQFTNELK